ncbi:conserved hypothetical protein, partial [Perkinsus marinus ATCC 50983]
NNPYYKTRMCQAFQQGLCQKGAYCNYAHGPDEMPPAPRRYKTELCKHFMEGKCGYGEHCSYAHSMEEIQQHAAANVASSPFQMQQSNTLTGQSLLQPQSSITPSVSLLESVRTDGSTRRNASGHGHHHKGKKLRTDSNAPAAVKICLDDL